MYLADSVRDVLAGLVVAADADVGVVGAIELVAARCLLLQQHRSRSRVDRKAGEGAMPKTLGVCDFLVLDAEEFVSVIEDVDQRDDVLT
jgi:hypothetical protein